MKNITYAKGMGIMGFAIGLIIILISVITPVGAFLISITACAPVLAVLSLLLLFLAPILKAINLVPDTDTLTIVFIYGPIYLSPLVYGLFGIIIGRLYGSVKNKLSIKQKLI